MHIVILAGGGGVRLWPLSRQDFPKQFLHFGDEQTLLQKTVSRFLNDPQTETITVSTNAQYAPLVQQQLQKIDPEQKTHILIEPIRKNTAPAIAFTMKYLRETLGAKDEAGILVLPSDHLIEPQSILAQYLKHIEPLVQKNHLVLFGIAPKKPETGYGYIQRGRPFDGFTYCVKRFVEKPDLATAQGYLASGDYYWNSGMFAFSMAHFWQTLEERAPDIYALLQGTIEDAIASFEKMPNISFDYAVLERSKDILVCPLPIDWSDIGCWDSVYDMMMKDAHQNAKHGNIFTINTQNSLILGNKRLIATVGVDDLLIVETDDATFISKRGESQKVKHVVEQLLHEKQALQHCDRTIHKFSWGTLQTFDKTDSYSIQKVQIHTGQCWESSDMGKSTLMPLSGMAHLKIDGKIIPISVKERIEVEKSQTISIANLEGALLELLYIKEC